MAVSSGDDANSNFWPGYVDAISTLVLGLLFLMIVLALAVFVFSAELAKRTLASSNQQQKNADAVEINSVVAGDATGGKTDASVSRSEHEEVIQLRARVKDLLMQQEVLKQKALESASSTNTGRPLLKDAPAGGGRLGARSSGEVEGQFRVEAGTDIQWPLSPTQSQLVTRGVKVQFSPGVLEVAKADQSRLRSSLKSLVSEGGALQISVVIDEGSSASRRAGFYRAMAVRDELMAMGANTQNLRIRLVDGGEKAADTDVLIAPAAALDSAKR